MCLTDADGFKTVPPRRSGQRLGDFIASSPAPRCNSNRFRPLSLEDWQDAAATAAEEARDAILGGSYPANFGFYVFFYYSFSLCRAFSGLSELTDCSCEWPGGGDCLRSYPLFIAVVMFSKCCSSVSTCFGIDTQNSIWKIQKLITFIVVLTTIAKVLETDAAV